ncbi:sine oculis-binding protein homolog isoform X2 [Bacillus rossius redtenbacheri]|uniref:sine oculis-binding protein homolog isoform X2 n=1 Tax=Bacillus rossius redtenbacheri TaxID=93214 RepID=UPI002FDEB96F
MGSRSTPPAAGSQPPRAVAVKKESPEDDIKEYAETAMNELLGWYGYDKVDSRDTQGLNLHHFAARRRSPSDLDSSDPESCSPGRRGAGTGSSQGSPPPDPLGVPPDCSVCGWCQKVCSNKQLFTLRTPAGQKAFCSELCFAQCRRANFKRNKTCDWCRHVRHTVNYVDFQDGEHQLQFCSDKCLNQYKMNIFCKETQAHLQMHPHLQDGPGAAAGTLITPELWLRDCRSESPPSDRSLSPPPPPLPPLPPPTPETPRSRRPARSRRPHATSPTDLRVASASSSPRSVDSASPLQPPPPPPLRLPPPPHLFPGPRLPLLRPPRTSPGYGAAQRPPPLLPLPLPRARAPAPAPAPPPPVAPHPLHRFLLPPVTVMVPYPVIVPIPVPVPIPIPIPVPLPPPKSGEAEQPPPEQPPPAQAQAQAEPPPPPAAEPPAGPPRAARPPRKRRRLEAVAKDEAVIKRKFVPA